MADHVMRLTVETWGTVSAEAQCLASPDAACRMMPTCQCDEWDLDHDDEGWFHTVEEYNPETDNTYPAQHRHTKPSESCNICDWLNADEPLDLLTGG